MSRYLWNLLMTWWLNIKVRCWWKLIPNDNKYSLMSFYSICWFIRILFTWIAMLGWTLRWPTITWSRRSLLSGDQVSRKTKTEKNGDRGHTVEDPTDGDKFYEISIPQPPPRKPTLRRKVQAGEATRKEEKTSGYNEIGGEGVGRSFHLKTHWKIVLWQHCITYDLTQCRPHSDRASLMSRHSIANILTTVFCLNISVQWMIISDRK